MNNKILIGVILWNFVWAAAVSAEEASPLTTLSGATLLVKTNGEIALIGNGGTAYLVKTNGLPPNILQYNGRSVEVKGEVWPGQSQMWFKIVGPIRFQPTTFENSSLVALKTGEEGEKHLFISTTSMKMYDVLTNDLPKDYAKYIGKSVDIVGEVLMLDGKQWVRITSVVPAKKTPKKPSSPSRKSSK